MARADRVCSHCADRSVADEMHVVFEVSCFTASHTVILYAALFTSETDAMRSFFGTEGPHAGFQFHP